MTIPLAKVFHFCNPCVMLSTIMPCHGAAKLNEPEAQRPDDLENAIYRIGDSDRIDCAGLGWTDRTVPQAQQTARPEPPTRDPHSPGYVQAKELPDETVPPPDQDGNFIIGPTHPPAPEMTAQELTHGSVFEFTMSSADSKSTRG